MSKEDKKILMIAATPFFSDRGCHIRIYNEIKYLNKKGYNIILTTYHNGITPEGINNVKRIINIPWYKKISPGPSWHKIYLDLFLLIISIKYFFKFRPKVIHAFLYESLLIAFIIKILSFNKVKIIFDSQGSLVHEMKAYTLNKNCLYRQTIFIFKLIEKLLLKIPDTIVCSSKNSYSIYQNEFKIDKKMEIINDGIDPDLFKNNNNSLLDINIPENNLVYLYTGSVTAAKGVDVLLNKVSEIIKQNEKITFIFAGYGDLVEKYTQKYSKYIETNNLFFIGRFSYFALPKLISIADYAIEPKNNSSESSGKIYNYIAGNLPVVCMKNDFLYNLLGGNGVYIKDFNDISQLNKPNNKPNYNIKEHIFQMEEYNKIYNNLSH